MQRTMGFCFWTGFYFLVLYAVSIQTRTLRTRQLYKIIVLPGLVIYSICRTLGCVVSVTPVEKVEFLHDKKLFLQPGSTKMHYVGHFVSAFGTVLPLFVVYYMASGLIMQDDWDYFSLPVFSDIMEEPSLIMSYLGTAHEILPYGTLNFWIACYMFLAVAGSVDLTFKELIATISVSTAGFFVFSMLDWLGIGCTFLSRSWFIDFLYADTWWGKGCFYLVFTFFSVLMLSGTLFMNRCVKWYGKRRKKKQQKLQKKVQKQAKKPQKEKVHA